MSDLSQIVIFAKLFSFILADPVLFTVNSILDDFYSADNVLASVNTLTSIDCVRQCSQYTSCHSMFYSASDQSCLLNSVRYTSGGISKPGVRYYEKAGSTVPAIDSAPTTVSGPTITNQITTIKADGSSTAGPTITNQITTMNPGVSPTAVSCLIKSCQNHGNCVNEICQCTPNYAGDYCQKAYSSSGCYWGHFSVELNIPSITPLICVDACIKESYEYAGLQIGYRCTCGSDISGFLQDTVNGCNVACNGDNAYICGGAQAMSIYHIV
ncbi:uncharacterized protein LOC143067333 isoform X2 [Mytilus galloprovincialis]|uniref:uncharacterized protein LOC143067333 isoform X2 n=1 Tax=Mytilus galloprovincialis TaxID=29158 RepID=UPI003F7BC821